MKKDKSRKIVRTNDRRSEQRGQRRDITEKEVT